MQQNQQGFLELLDSSLVTAITEKALVRYCAVLYMVPWRVSGSAAGLEKRYCRDVFVAGAAVLRLGFCGCSSPAGRDQLQGLSVVLRVPRRACLRVLPQAQVAAELLQSRSADGCSKESGQGRTELTERSARRSDGAESPTPADPAATSFED